MRLVRQHIAEKEKKGERKKKREIRALRTNEIEASLTHLKKDKKREGGGKERI